MLTGFPVYLYFKNGNVYTGAEGGMRFRLVTGKLGEGENERFRLLATVWPGPWSLEHTAEEKYVRADFSPDQQGLDAAAAWLAQQYEAGREAWENIPSILDCQPDR